MQRTPAHDLIIKQGTTFKRRIRFKVSGVVQSLVGFTVQLSVQPENSGTPINLLSTDPPSDPQIKIDTTDLNDNFVEILFSPTVTNAIIWDYAVYRLDLTDPTGVVRRKLKGRLIIELKPS